MTTVFQPRLTLSTVLIQTTKLDLDDALLLLFLAFGGLAYLLKGTAWDAPNPYLHLVYEKPQEANGKSAPTGTRDIAKKLEETNKDIVIFWGSQSGTAEGFASRLTRDFRRRLGLNAMAADLSDYDPWTISSIPSIKTAIFIISTYGEGDPSDNTAGFWDWLNATTDISLPNLKYAAFGLGNKNYKYYNRVIDVVSAALQKAGAIALFPVSYADDSQGGTEEDFLAWKEQLFQALVEKWNMAMTERAGSWEPDHSVQEDDSLDIIDLHLGEPFSVSIKSANMSAVAAAQVKSTQTLFESRQHTRDCLHIELDLQDHPTIKYKTGDHLAVWPSNPTQEVERLLRVLGLASSKDKPLLITSCDPTNFVCKVPSPTTVSALFSFYLEIISPVSRETIATLAVLAPTPSIKASLNKLAQDKDAYEEFLSTQYLTLGRLLEWSLEPGTSWGDALPLALIIDMLPASKSRYYSISSSAIVHPRNPSITALVIGEEGPPAVVAPGRTTNYLLALHEYNNQRSGVKHGPSRYSFLQEGKLHIQVRTSKFKLPMRASDPILLIATGTGIAPFRAFLQERKRLASVRQDVVGSAVLFYGCRDESEFLYQDEFRDFQNEGGVSLRIITAFSRQMSSGDKVYVQDRIEENADLVGSLLCEQSATVYLCGSARMARDVAGRIDGLLVKRNGWDANQVREWRNQQLKAKKWQEDVWG